jgi:hypothetical protein
MNRSNIDDAFATLGAILIVFAQAAVVTQPGESAFDHPATGQDLKSRKVRVSTDNLEDDLQVTSCLVGIVLVDSPLFYQAGIFKWPLSENTGHITDNEQEAGFAVRPPATQILT